MKLNMVYLHYLFEAWVHINTFISFILPCKNKLKILINIAHLTDWKTMHLFNESEHVPIPSIVQRIYLNIKESLIVF